MAQKKGRFVCQLASCFSVHIKTVRITFGDSTFKE